MNDQNIKKMLIEKGVQMPCPESVEIGPEVDPERISGERVKIHTGCKIYGGKTLIMPGSELGFEAPATLMNCQLGRDVSLLGGFYKESTFLEGASIGSGAQIREGCLLEEGTSCAHTVGLKQTILFPFVVLGSIVNFCDCLMAGGTGRKDHSEVGSSFIHFNYTPNQDKATASLIGDVPMGVMINQKPIFLGGQGGIVGPVKITYGTIVAAGTIVRKDILKGGMIIFGHASYNRRISFTPGLYTGVRRIIRLNTEYIANIIALKRWYMDVRSRLMGSDKMGQALFEGAVEKIDYAFKERVKRLGDVAVRMPESVEIFNRNHGGGSFKQGLKMKMDFFEKWHDMESAFNEGMNYAGDASKRDEFLNILEKVTVREGADHIEAVKGLTPSEAEVGTMWLGGIVEETKRRVSRILESSPN
jgi:bifunctional UDP-N-acetylglucosamine pyrophosphorylase / glucosamine-1-phosphate N-acetyltransferase